MVLLVMIAEELKSYYVYVLMDDGGNVFYVGKGTGGRMTYHVKVARSLSYPCYEHRYRAIWSILAQGGIVRGARLYFTLNEQRAYEVEREVIEFFDSPCLTNGTLYDGRYGFTIDIDRVKEHKKSEAAARRIREEHLALEAAIEEERKMKLMWALINRTDFRYFRSLARCRVIDYRARIAGVS